MRGGFKRLNLAREGVAPGQKLCGLYMELLNRPGALWDVLRHLVKHRVNLLCVSVPSAELVEPFITVFLVGDITEAEVSTSELIEALKRDPNVVSVEEVREIIKGVIVDTKHFPLTLHDMRVVMMGEVVLRPIVTTLKRRMGPVVNAVLWHMGYAIGPELAKVYERAYGTLRPRDYFLLLAARTTELGWGYAEKVEVDEDKRIVKLAVRDLWECAFSEPSREPQSHLYRGIIAGLGSAAFGVDMRAVEESCLAKGDGVCSFVVAPKKAEWAPPSQIF